MQPIDRAARVLVVDDDAVVRTGMARLLEAQGLETEVAGDGVEALEKLDLRPFAVVFLVIKMPGMDGVEVLRQIRAQHPRVLVIMITGYPTMESAIECLKLGAVDYLVKPFRADELEVLLLKALEVLRRQEKALEPLFSQEFGIASIPASLTSAPRWSLDWVNADEEPGKKDDAQIVPLQLSNLMRTRSQPERGFSA